MVVLRAGGVRRRSAVVLAAVVALSWSGSVPAAADVLGEVVVTPSSGQDTTLFRGAVTGADCPAGTDDALFDVIGSDVGVGAARGQGEIGFLGPASRDGRGDQAFVGASIANLRAVGAGAFTTSGPYRIRLRCQRGAELTAAYETVLDYTAGGAGSFTVRGPRRPVPASATSPGRPRSVVGEAGPVAGATDVAPTSAAVPAPLDPGMPLPGGAGVSAPGGAAAPSTGSGPAGGAGALAATSSTPARTEPGAGLIGWIGLAVVVIGAGALALAGLERRWRLLTMHGVQPADAGSGRR